MKTTKDNEFKIEIREAERESRSATKMLGLLMLVIGIISFFFILLIFPSCS